jgi:hypothetical protein
MCCYRTGWRRGARPRNDPLSVVPADIQVRAMKLKTWTEKRWICASKHEHLTKAKAVKCERIVAAAKERKRIAGPPRGYLTVLQARDRLREEGGFHTNTYELTGLVNLGLLVAIKSRPKRGKLFISTREVRRIIASEAETVSAALGKKERKPRAAYTLGQRVCPACGDKVSVTTKGLFYNHRRDYLKPCKMSWKPAPPEFDLSGVYAAVSTVVPIRTEASMGLP